MSRHFPSSPCYAWSRLNAQHLKSKLPKSSPGWFLLAVHVSHQRCLQQWSLSSHCSISCPKSNTGQCRVSGCFIKLASCISISSNLMYLNLIFLYIKMKHVFVVACVFYQVIVNKLYLPPNACYSTAKSGWFAVPWAITICPWDVHISSGVH